MVLVFAFVLISFPLTSDADSGVMVCDSVRMGGCCSTGYRGKMMLKRARQLVAESDILRG